MAKVLILLLLVAALILFSGYGASAQASSCDSFIFPLNKKFLACSDLQVLDSAIHWTLDSTSGTVDVAFRHSVAGGDRRWVSWAINPTSQGMVGSQALVAFPKTDGSIFAYTSPVMSYKTPLQPGNLAFPVRDLSAAVDNNNQFIIFATIQLPNNFTTVNHLWQEGPMSGDNPMIHSVAASTPNLKSMGTLDLLSGRTTATSSTSKNKLKYLHGSLNTQSWGFMMPIGVMIARYVHARYPDSSLWFNLHVLCQVVASLVGLLGFGTGIFISYKSSGLLQNDAHIAHLTMGIVLVLLLLVQIFWAFFRPHEGEKGRTLFEWGHRLGWLILLVSIANIIQGFIILSAAGVWLGLYCGTVVAMLLCFVLLEWFNQSLSD